MQLDAYLQRHLAPHGDQPIIYSDMLADQMADVCLHWLQHDDDGRRAAWRVAHPERYREPITLTPHVLATINVYRAEQAAGAAAFDQANEAKAGR